MTVKANPGSMINGALWSWSNWSTAEAIAVPAVTRPMPLLALSLRMRRQFMDNAGVHPGCGPAKKDSAQRINPGGFTEGHLRVFVLPEAVAMRGSSMQIIRLDVPYAEGATRMRAALITFDPMGINLSGPVANIPEAISVLKPAGDAVTLVYPHDDRHDLAWAAKEEADKRSWQFARHIPRILEIPPDLETAYESFDTGSAEDALDAAAAQRRILQLGEEGREYFSTGMDMLPAMRVLRHALWLALRFFGWQNPGTALMLRNLGYVLRATGNQDNIDEFIYLLRRMVFVWGKQPPDKSVWAGSEPVIGQINELADSTGAGSSLPPVG